MPAVFDLWEKMNTFFYSLIIINASFFPRNYVNGNRIGCSVIEKVFSFEFDQSCRGGCTRVPNLDLTGRVLSQRERSNGIEQKRN